LQKILNFQGNDEFVRMGKHVKPVPMAGPSMSPGMKESDRMIVWPVDLALAWFTLYQSLKEKAINKTAFNLFATKLIKTKA
jgi:hypothetical protein